MFYEFVTFLENFNGQEQDHNLPSSFGYNESSLSLLFPLDSVRISNTPSSASLLYLRQVNPHTGQFLTQAGLYENFPIKVDKMFFP